VDIRKRHDPRDLPQRDLSRSERSISVNGIGEASLFYFNKEVSELFPGEGATMATNYQGSGNLLPLCRTKSAAASGENWGPATHAEAGWISEESSRGPGAIR